MGRFFAAGAAAIAAVAMVIIAASVPAPRGPAPAAAPTTSTATAPATPGGVDARGRLVIDPTIEAVTAASAFSFAIVSDHKGLAPANSKLMANTVTQIRQAGAKFVVGLGDHLTYPMLPHPFLDFIAKDPFWKRHFYPNIADGENAYYSMNQSAWGAGGKLLTAMNMAARGEVTVRKNGCEYTARIAAGPYVVHLIQLHYPDEPADAAKAFPADSRRYLLATLAGIDKRPGRDIVIVAAHTGNWVRKLTLPQRKAVLAKADLILGATSHYFQRYNYGPTGPLGVNTGAVGYANKANGRYDGWVSVHVLRRPPALLVQYQDARAATMQVVKPAFRFLKVLGGEARPAVFAKNLAKRP